MTLWSCGFPVKRNVVKCGSFERLCWFQLLPKLSTRQKEQNGQHWRVVTNITTTIKEDKVESANSHLTTTLEFVQTACCLTSQVVAALLAVIIPRALAHTCRVSWLGYWTCDTPLSKRFVDLENRTKLNNNDNVCNDGAFRHDVVRSFSNNALGSFDHSRARSQRTSCCPGAPRRRLYQSSRRTSPHPTKTPHGHCTKIVASSTLVPALPRRSAETEVRVLPGRGPQAQLCRNCHPFRGGVLRKKPLLVPTSVCFLTT